MKKVNYYLSSIGIRITVTKGIKFMSKNVKQ